MFPSDVVLPANILHTCHLHVYSIEWMWDAIYSDFLRGPPELWDEKLSDIKGKERENGDEPCQDPK